MQYEVGKLQDAVKNSLNPILRKEILDGRLIDNIPLLNGAINHVQHGLQRAVNGYIVVKKNVSLNPGVGGAKIWLSATPPSGWLICDGTAISRTTYAALFAKIGTTYGVGDGSTTFNIPDFRQRFPLGKAAAGTGSTLGGTGGNIDHVHTIPAHTHGLVAAHAKLGYADSTNEFYLNVQSVSTNYTNILSMSAFTDAASSGNMGAGLNLGGTTDSGGSGNTGTNNPPFLSVNFIIQIDNFDINTSVWDGEAVNAAKESFLDLYSAANMTVSLWVF